MNDISPVGVTSIGQVAAPYAHELVFLFMGGFIMALAMQRWGLHRRFALSALRLFGTEPHRMVGGFMAVTAFLSMWVSNTATTLMMLPIAISVINLTLKKNEEETDADGDVSTEQDRNFKLCLLLCIAYASIGGIGTLIGTPPNLFLASYIEANLNREISFMRWMGIGLPVVAVFLPITWLMMTRLIYPLHMTRIEGGSAVTQDAYRKLGPMNPGERATGIVFCATVVAWISRPLLTQIEIGGTLPPLHPDLLP